MIQKWRAVAITAMLAGLVAKVKVSGGQNANPTHESWYVDYSPYSIGVISDIDVVAGVNSNRRSLARNGHFISE
jgi:hypothetical protein